MIGALSVAVGGVTVLISAIIGSVTLWRIAHCKRKDRQIQQIKNRADAHRRLWYVLRQIDADEKREREERAESMETWYIKNVVDNKWLRDYFRDNAVLLATELHNAYQETLSTPGRFREMFREHEGEDTDIQAMLAIAKKEMEEYDRRYKEMGGFDPTKR